MRISFDLDYWYLIVVFFSFVFRFCLLFLVTINESTHQVIGLTVFIVVQNLTWLINRCRSNEICFVTIVDAFNTGSCSKNWIKNVPMEAKQFHAFFKLAKPTLFKVSWSCTIFPFESLLVLYMKVANFLYNILRATNLSTSFFFHDLGQLGSVL